MNDTIYELVKDTSLTRMNSEEKVKGINPSKELFEDIVEKVKFATGDWELTKRNITWYAAQGLISKSERDGRWWVFPARTSRDLIALWVTKIMLPVQLTDLVKAMKKSHSRLYQVIEMLQWLEYKLVVYMNTTGVPTLSFIEETVNRVNLRKDYFQMLNSSVHPLHIDIKFEYGYIQDTRTMCKK